MIGIAAGATGIAAVVLIAGTALIALIATGQKQRRGRTKNEDYSFHNFTAFFSSLQRT